MKKVIVFGTGGAAERFIKQAGHLYDMIGFSDNNPQKHGTVFAGRPVYPPAQLPKMECDQILLATMWHREVRQQLLDYGIPGERILALPKAFASEGKRFRPFGDPATLAFARELLVWFCQVLEEEGIPCFVDHGTLLGLVRDHDIMAWDDDIDLSVAAENSHKVYEILHARFKEMPGADRYAWTPEIVFNFIDGDSAVWVTPTDPHGQLRSFNVGISFYRTVGDIALEAINWAPARHYLESVWIDTPLGRFRAPGDYENYLALHYGNWRTPVKDISFGDISNFKPVELPALRLVYDWSIPGEADRVIREARNGIVKGKQLNLALSLPENIPASPAMQTLPGTRWVDPAHVRRSLDVLSQVMQVDQLTLLGPDAHNHPRVLEILSWAHSHSMADTLTLQISAADRISAPLMEHLKTLGAHVRVILFDSPLPGQPELLDALAAAGIPCDVRPPRKHVDWSPPADYSQKSKDLVNQVRCAKKRSWTLWGDVLARCPRTLVAWMEQEGRETSMDILNIQGEATAMKAAWLQIIRRGPCEECAACVHEDPPRNALFTTPRPDVPETGDSP